MKGPLHLFQGYGVELEYMIVDRTTLDVRSLADHLLRSSVGEPQLELQRGDFAWSNELALHVLEMKTAGPSPTLKGLADGFQREISAASQYLAEVGARLLPTAMHPWMDPVRESRLWPHEQGPIYQAYDRIFDCRGHGWTNVQSVHLNLPFAGDIEFGRLHAAIRAVLPLLPALAASSPYVEGRAGEALDARLDYYCRNQKRVPAIAGLVIPERVWTRSGYRRKVLWPMYQEIAPLDPAGVLQEEWLNSRGAIARFERSAIEIRLLDIQETPRADCAILRLVDAVIRALLGEKWVEQEVLRQLDEAVLGGVLQDCIRTADQAWVADPGLLRVFGFTGALRAGELWSRLTESLLDGAVEPDVVGPLQMIANRGPLARRILKVCGREPDRSSLRDTYLELADCLERGELFDRG